MPRIARLGDTSSHGGHIITASSNGKDDGIAIAVQGDLHSCPISGHGTTTLTAMDASVTLDGMPIIKTGDTAGCGAIITAGSPDTTSRE